jgi:drug/metabolite transporter (DMT)-like permease
MHNHNTFLILLCVVMWGIGTFLNRLSVEHMSPFLMQVVAGLVFLLYIPYALRASGVGNPFTYSWSISSVIYTILATCISIAANICLYTTLKGNNHTGANTMLISLYPVITLLLSVMFLGEHLGWLKILGVVAMIVGSVLLSWN